MQDKPTQAQLDELKRLSKEARVPDESEVVTSAERRIKDLKERHGWNRQLFRPSYRNQATERPFFPTVKELRNRARSLSSTIPPP
jgi:hypothetical protein